jgi:hypothetical protein
VKRVSEASFHQIAFGQWLAFQDSRDFDDLTISGHIKAKALNH